MNFYKRNFMKKIKILIDFCKDADGQRYGQDFAKTSRLVVTPLRRAIMARWGSLPCNRLWGQDRSQSSNPASPRDLGRVIK